MKLFELDVNNRGSVAFCWGRFQPPHLAHGNLFRMLEQYGSYDSWICAGQTVDAKNPLDFQTKMSFVKQQFPEYASHVLDDPMVKTIFQAVVAIYNKYDPAVSESLSLIYVGDFNRVSNFVPGLNKFNGVESKHGYYKFKEIKSAATKRDVDSETNSTIADPNQDVGLINSANISGSLVRNLAKTDQFDKFKKTVSKTGEEPWVKQMFFALGGKTINQ